MSQKRSDVSDQEACRILRNAGYTQSEIEDVKLLRCVLVRLARMSIQGVRRTPRVTHAKGNGADQADQVEVTQ